MEDDDIQIIEPDMGEEIVLPDDNDDKNDSSKDNIETHKDQHDSKSNVLEIAEIMMQQQQNGRETEGSNIHINSFGDLPIQIKTEPLDEYYGEEVEGNCELFKISSKFINFYLLPSKMKKMTMRMMKKMKMTMMIQKKKMILMHLNMVVILGIVFGSKS